MNYPICKPIFSIIIPTYNRAEYICNAIDSVMTQTFGDYELIVVDDGSSDDTFSRVLEYYSNKILYVYKQNGGQNSANNVALRLARGEYIAFLDSDDIWLKEKLEKTYQMFQSDHEIGVVYNYTGLEKEDDIILAREDKIEGWCYKEVLDQGFLTSPSFLACKRSCFDVIGEFDVDQRACQDDDLCFKLCKNYKVGLIKEILGVYGTSADDQIVKDKTRGAVYYLRLLDKYRDDILSICGKEVMIKKYKRAIRLFGEIGDKKTVNELMERIKNL